ncbi:MAG: TonB-dependent receptor [bacterium]|nr:TonB-dependent receptor [bacterium]
MKKLEKLKKLKTLLCVFTALFAYGVLWSADPVSQSNASSEAKQKKESKGKKKAGDKKVKEKKAKKPKENLHYEVTVTATRTKRDTFDTPSPVSVLNREKIQEKAPNNVTELLTELPGVDVNGVGANQSRPVIRGLRGQRILLMEDGIRLNNSRRQQDFGEIPGMVDINDVDRVEVVRGPASVLYGSDAIGGVVNIISRMKEYDTEGNEIHGSLGYRYGSAEEQSKVVADINGHVGKLGVRISGNYRKANDYQAPAGSFGNIELADDTTVFDTGVKDHGMKLQLTYALSKKNRLSFKYDYYNSENSGFGFIEPEFYDPGSARIQIRYPMQKVQKYSLKYENRDLKFVLADNLDITVYHLINRRELDMDIFIPFNIPRIPEAGMILESDNYTDIGTLGARVELNKSLKNHLFTYGVDFFRDKTENTDSSVQAMVGFGPPHPVADTTPQVPNSLYRSMGVFLQDEIGLFKRSSLILGVRYQNVNAHTKATPGLEDQPEVDSTDHTLVGAANFIIGVSDHLRLVLSVGRGFRSPNLIERFFNGMTPEGSGFQSLNPDLEAETSLNLDVGFKYRRKNVYLEATYFNNVIDNGIRISATGNMINGMQEYQNVNVDKLRMRGLEFVGKLYLNFGLALGTNITYIKSKDLGNPETPYVDTYSSKLNFNARYSPGNKLFYVEYSLRVNGEQKDVQLGDNPIGTVIPGFTVHSIGAGITLFKKSRFPQQLGLVVGNLTNQLYSEFSNASFFRPAPRRHVVLTWSTRF